MKKQFIPKDALFVLGCQGFSRVGMDHYERGIETISKTEDGWLYTTNNRKKEFPSLGAIVQYLNGERRDV